MRYTRTAAHDVSLKRRRICVSARARDTSAVLLWSHVVLFMPLDACRRSCCLCSFLSWRGPRGAGKDIFYRQLRLRRCKNSNTVMVCRYRRRTFTVTLILLLGHRRHPSLFVVVFFPISHVYMYVRMLVDWVGDGVASLEGRRQRCGAYSCF